MAHPVSECSPTALAAALDHTCEPSMTVREFCDAERISVAFYYKQRGLGLGPREMRNGRRVTISSTARRDWQRARESAARAAAAAERTEGDCDRPAV